jgi:SAM-dependent methyltransferase
MHADGYFDERVAATYDEDAARLFAPEVLGPTVDVLTELAGDGAALELGVGTGRVALPLAARGIPICGIELSRAMTAQLRSKAGGEDIAVTTGDFATTRVPGVFSLAYVVFNTIMNLTTQESQVACFRNAAAHLRSGGRFVVEVMVPALQRLSPGESDRIYYKGDDFLGVDEYDVVNQGLVSHYYERVGDMFEHSSMPFRYVFPAELDLMASLAGMSLVERWGNWNKEPFTTDCEKHASVWQKDETPE